MLRSGVDKDEAARKLAAAGGLVRRAVGEPPPVAPAS
jgi:hypothetical protein